MKKLLTIFIFLLPFFAFAQNQIDVKDAEIRRYFIWDNDQNRNAATGDSVMAFVAGSDTATMVPIGALGGYWTEVGYYLYPTNTNDSVGINTSTPDHRFTVNGRMSAAYDTTNRTYFLAADSSGGVISLMDTSRFSGGGTGYWSRTGNYVYPATIGDSVGVGTATPWTDLEVNGGFAAQYKAGTKKYILMADSAGGEIYMLDTANVGLKENWTRSGGDLSPSYPTDNVYMNDSIYMTALPYKVCDTMLGIFNDTIFRMVSPSGGGDTAIWYVDGDSLKNKSPSTYDYIFPQNDFFTDRNNNSTSNTLFGVGAAPVLSANGNSAFGFNSLKNTAGGVDNSAFGENSMRVNVSGSSNCAFGVDALRNSIGSGNSAFGKNTLFYNESIDNSAFGFEALKLDTSGQKNTAIGSAAMGLHRNSDNNSAFGYRALYQNVDGEENLAIGTQSLSQNVNGNNNTAIGYYAGRNNTGSGGVFIGSQAGENETSSNLLYIDNSNTTTPLAWGDFSNNYFTVHGNLGIGTKAPAAQIHVHDETGSLGALLYMYHTTAGNYPQLNFAKFNGTSSSYNAIAGNTLMGGVNFSGSYSASASRGGAAIRVKSSQLWASDENGCEMYFYTTENDSSTSDVSMKIDSNANVLVQFGDVITFGGWAAWTPTLAWTGGTPGAATVAARYQVINRTVYFIATIDGSNDSGSTLTALNITLPITPKDVNTYPPIPCLYNNAGKVSFAGLLGAYVDATDGTEGNRKLYTLTFSIANEADYIFTFEGFYEITSK